MTSFLPDALPEEMLAKMVVAGPSGNSAMDWWPLSLSLGRWTAAAVIRFESAEEVILILRLGPWTMDGVVDEYQLEQLMTGQQLGLAGSSVLAIVDIYAEEEDVHPAEIPG